MMAEGIQVIGLSEGKLHTKNVEIKEGKNTELFATRSGMLQLQSTLNEQLVAQNEIMTAELKAIREIVAPLNTTLKEFSKHLVKTKEQLIKLWQSNLLNEEQIEKMSRSNKTLDEKCKKHVIGTKIMGKEIQKIKDEIEKIAPSSKEHKNLDELRFKDTMKMQEDLEQIKNELEAQPKSEINEQNADTMKTIQKEIEYLRSESNKQALSNVRHKQIIDMYKKLDECEERDAK